MGSSAVCHAVRVKLSSEERASARRLTGYLVPAYAAVALTVIALAAATSGPRSGDLVASTSATITAPK
jgi:hypothetical protein